MKLYIGIPTGRDWKSGFGVSMLSLTQYLTVKVGNGELEDFYVKVQSGLLPKTRQELLLDAIAKGFTHLLFIDDDMQFTPQTIESLMGRKLPVVAVNGTKRKFPIEGVAFDMAGERIDSTGKTGVQEVTFVGTGIMLVDLEAMKHVPAPHFEVVWEDSLQTYVPEDTYFCGKLRDFGVPIYIDHEASRSTRHIGDYSYGFRGE